MVATKSITIEKNVMIGGAETIVDSDFHSLIPYHWHTIEIKKKLKSLRVVIKDNVFIGMDSIILKGVNAGTNSIIAAESVVLKDISENQIWSDNPIKFIKEYE